MSCASRSLFRLFRYEENASELQLRGGRAEERKRSVRGVGAREDERRAAGDGLLVAVEHGTRAQKLMCVAEAHELRERRVRLEAEHAEYGTLVSARGVQRSRGRVACTRLAEAFEVSERQLLVGQLPLAALNCRQL